MTRDYILICINQYYRDSVNVMFECSCACIAKKHGFYKFWWDEELTLMKDTAIQSFNIWSKFGTEFDNMKRDKLKYKLAIKEKERFNVNSFSDSDSLNDALSSKDMDSFWRTWRS